MGRKGMLTLSDLYQFFVNQNKTVKFSAADEDRKIIVQVDGTVNFAKTDNKKGLLPVTLQSCHIGDNLNRSRIEEKVMKNALSSFQNRPILGFIHDVDGQPEFYGHNMYIDDEGELVYEEHMVGVIPESCNARLEFDSEKNKTYVVVNGYVYEEYSKAAEILRREGECAVSVELDIDQLSYDAADKILVIEAFTFNGVTILGKDDDGNDVKPGMVGANIKIADFSKENNSLVEQIKSLNEKLDRFNKNFEKGGNPVGMNEKFQELLEKYGKTVEDITFEYEGLTDEELESAFASAFETQESEDEPAESEQFVEEGEDPDGEGEPEGEDEDPEEPEIPEEDESEEEGNFAKASITYEGNVHEFSISLNDKIAALYTLVNDTYADEDCTWYDVVVYEEEKSVTMIGYCGRAFRQSYKVKKDVYTLVGDRVEVFAKWLTQDEINKLDSMKSEYSEMSEKLSHYEDEPKKMEILNSEDYSLIADNEEFVKLCEQSEHFNMSVEEVAAKADSILTEAAKHKSFSLNNEQKKDIVKPLPQLKRKSKRFGSLFDGII